MTAGDTTHFHEIQFWRVSVALVLLLLTICLFSVKVVVVVDTTFVMAIHLGRYVLYAAIAHAVMSIDDGKGRKAPRELSEGVPRR